MARFVKIDGKWFNPEQVVAVAATGRSTAGFTKIVTTVGDFTVGRDVDEVIAALEEG